MKPVKIIREYHITDDELKQIFKIEGKKIYDIVSDGEGGIEFSTEEGEDTDAGA